MFQSGGMPQARPGSAPTPQQQQQQQMAQLMAQQQFLAANPHLAAANPGLQAQLQVRGLPSGPSEGGAKTFAARPL